ncbi:penicillin acylase family protein [Shewanella maritima]|uniref:penicillin acylase family protein n=1 Tax=Shewanella maritima TaxID=2520507 RepID=UPI00373511A2
MTTIITRVASVIFFLVLISAIAIYSVFTLSLPKLSDTIMTDNVDSYMQLSRDQLGTAIIKADTRADAAYGLGYAHGQDRYFQMDLLRRNAAGELAEIFGEKAIKLDESKRFHQLRMRAQAIFDTMPSADKQLLERYAQGVNDAVNAQRFKSFEYVLTNTSPSPWQPSDSLLVIYSMYLDLQGNTIKRDLVLTQIQRQFGQQMVDFIIQPSPYQAALDASEVPLQQLTIPQLQAHQKQALLTHNIDIEDIAEVGSNNWAVSGVLTSEQAGMLSDDMHLSFAVPIIWYRAQLNYTNQQGESAQITGVSLPGAPAIVVGTNGHVAWGFTNAYVDTADWVKVDETQINTVDEIIKTPSGEHVYPLQMSEYGPVRELDGQRYALSWVGHQTYAVDMQLMALEQAKDVLEVNQLAQQFGIPVQNLVSADSQGNIAWTLAGAAAQRATPYNTAISADAYQSKPWQTNIETKPQLVNPAVQRIWTANSRVVSTDDLAQYGDGGYALGARATQIRKGLLAKKSFTEHDFYDLQLDNQAQFLSPWHRYLTRLLSQYNQSDDIDVTKHMKQIKEWQGCACKESVGYTLVKYFRAEMINQIFAPIEAHLMQHDLSLSSVKRYLEPALWQLIKHQPDDWLPETYSDWDEMAFDAYKISVNKLLAKYSDNQRLSDLTWGRVNALTVQHPFSKQLPILAPLLDMPVRAGFGDSFMPAVQGKSFGASQRFIVQPGHENKGIMTIPGGQSGHPLSDFYRSGFNDYVNNRKTPLLPSEAIHTIEFKAK